MEYYHNILGIESAWLIDEGVMTKATYEKCVTRRDIQIIRRGCRSNAALVSYESLPTRFKRKVDERIDVYKIARKNDIEESIVDDTAIAKYFDEYIISGDRHLPLDKRREYYTNAIILEAIGRVISHRKTRCQAIGRRYRQQWNILAEMLLELDPTRYPHTLPTNARRLEGRYRQYCNEGCAALVHRSYVTETRNAAKVNDERQEATIAMLVSDPRNLDDQQVANLYNMLAREMRWKTISRYTVANYRTRMDNTIFARRHGAKAYSNEKAMQVKRTAPTTAMTLWTMDGWDVELMYKARDQKSGKTTYHNRLTCVFVLDTCCRYPIGYAIGTHESPALIQEALREAALQTERLFGQMYNPLQLQSDNYQMGALRPLYDRVADKVTPAAVGNAKSKIIERWFNYFNKKYCQLMPNWSGFGVTSRKELQPNVDFLNQHRHLRPDLTGVIEQIVTAIEAERTELHDRYMAAWDGTPTERRLPLSYEQYLLNYGSWTGNKNLLQGNGLQITIGGEKHSYDTFDLTFRDYATTRWEIRYDPDDLRKVLAVNDDETRQYLLTEKYVQPMALADRKEGDYEELQRVFDFNRQNAERIAQKIGAATDCVTALMTEQAANRELGTLQKLLLVDSSGQHKNRRNEARLMPTTADDITVLPKRGNKSKPKRMATNDNIHDITTDEDNIYNDY